MGGQSTRRECQVCGAALHLLQSTCGQCETASEWVCLADCRECGRETDYLDGACVCGATHSPWRVVELVALEEGSVTVAKDAVPRPTAAGYQRHVGTIRGQWADYRRELDSGGEFHVRVFLDHYELHVDEVGALGEPTMHTLRYGPSAAVTTGTDVVRAMRAVTRRAGDLTRTALRVSSALLPSRQNRSNGREQ